MDPPGCDNQGCARAWRRPLSMMPNKQKIALFDLDKTLLPIDSDYAWGLFTTAIGWTDAEQFARRNEEFYTQYQAGTLDVHEYVRFATDAVRQRGVEAAQAARTRFLAEVIEPVVRPEALALVRKHQDAGDHVAIITATNEFVTRPIADRFGVSELIAVELDRDAQGWITGEIRGTPSFREGKVLRFAQWLRERQTERAAVDVTFYTDSTNDVPLLEQADHPVATNPDEALRALAGQRGWRVLDLFSA